MEFQNEKWLLKLLPYYEELKIEADEKFKEIKLQIGKAIEHGDIDLGLHFWTRQLDDYINDFSFRFTLEDHVLLIENYYSLITTIPKLNFVLVERYAKILNKLLSKRRILKPRKFVLDWKPLFDVYWEVRYKGYDSDDVMMISDDLRAMLDTLISRCNPYFSSKATQEILDQMAPYMNPSDEESMKRAMQIWELFLPTALTLQQHNEYGAALWFDNLCLWFYEAWNNPSWTWHCIRILGRLGSESPNIVYWSKHCETIFQIVLRNLDLQINFIGLEDTGENGSKMIIKIGHGTDAPAYSTSVLVANMLGDTENKTEKCLGLLYGFLENYLHPSNDGSWVEKVLDFTRELTLSMCRRVHKERHCDKVDWLETRNKRLTDYQIEQFVLTILPCAKFAIFNKDHDKTGCKIMKYLSRLAPKLVLPTVLEMQFSALETLTEPHRLTQTLNCTSDLLIMVLRGDDGVRDQIIPLLNEMLDGIDPNECDKTVQTAKVMQTVCSLIPLCESTDHDDMNAEREMMPYQSGLIEDLVITLTDKILSFVQSVEDGYVGESSYHEHAIQQQDAASCPDVMAAGDSLIALFRALCCQSSTSIKKLIENKLYNFIMESNFSSENAANITSFLLGSFVQSESPSVFNKFLAGMKLKIEGAAKGCDLESDILPQSLISSIRITYRFFIRNGVYLLENNHKIVSLLHLIAPIKSKQIRQHINFIITNVFRSLCTTRFRLKPEGQSKADNKWAMGCGRNAEPVDWQLPSNEGLKLAKELLAKLMVPNLERLKDDSFEDREQLLGIIGSCFDGAAESLPPLPGENINLHDSMVDFNTHGTISRPANIDILTMPDGSNVRLAMFDVLHPVLKFLLNTDDSKSMLEVGQLLAKIAVFRGYYMNEQKDKEFDEYEDRVSDIVQGSKADLQCVTHEKVMKCHIPRVLSTGTSAPFTQIHISILKDLLLLATNNYVNVRIAAQNRLKDIFTSYFGCYIVLLDQIIELLKADPTSEMDKLKGVLGLVLETEMLVVPHWGSIHKLWPAVIQIQQTENETIVELLQKAEGMLIQKFETFVINAELQPRILHYANELQGNVDNYNGSSVELYKGAENRRLYYELIDNLLRLLSDNHLHWRPQYMANLMLNILIRIDQTMPDKVVLHYLSLITHHSSGTRKRAVEAITAWLKLNKPLALKIEAQTDEVRRKHEMHFHAGLKKLMYKKKAIPTSQKQWNETEFVDKSCYGVKAWPREFKLYAPASQQLHRNRESTELNHTEKQIVEKFYNAEFLAEFIHLMTADETDDYLLRKSAKMFKGLFCNYNDLLLEPVQSMLEGLVTTDKKEKKQLACAFIFGIIRGSKLWNASKIELLWEWLGPLIKKALETINEDAFAAWFGMLGKLSNNMDPRRFHYIYEIMFEVLARDGNRISHACNFHLLRVMLEQGGWKVMELWDDLLSLIVQYSNASSESICLAQARCLQRILCWNTIGFEFDTELQETLPQLQQVLLQIQINSETSFNFGQLTTSDNGPEKNNKQIYYTRLLANFIAWMFSKGHMHLSPPFFDFILQLCQLANTAKNDELNVDVNYALVAMAAAVTPKQHLAPLLDLCQNVAIVLLSCNLNNLLQNYPQRWKSKVALLSFLHVSVLNNYYSYISDPELCFQIIQMVSFFISNENIHVQLAARNALTDLIRFKIVHVEKDLLPNVHKLLKSSKSSEQRAAVLTLTAVVKAFPYSVPNFLPRILVLLTRHMNNNSYGVKGEVSKAMFEFKRTHQDGWHEHKNKFTEEQLEIINDSLCTPASYIV